MRIFAIDDEKLSKELLRLSIIKAKPNAELEMFENPEELILRSKEIKCDVAFLDIRLPGITGIELAKLLMEDNPDINIIFVTGYSEYMPEAFEMFASGYVTKPINMDEVSRQLDHLRKPVNDENKVFIRTFGNFSVLVNGVPVKIRLAKSMELLAYLVDRGGSIVGRREIASVIFENGDFNRKTQKYLTTAARELEKDLEAAGISEIFVRNNNGYYVNKNYFECDMYDFLQGKCEYYGEYMEQYSWGENFKAYREYMI